MSLPRFFQIFMFDEFNCKKKDHIAAKALDFAACIICPGGRDDPLFRFYLSVRMI